MIYILYSDDYELYLGGNYLPEERVLLETTDHLLSACETGGFPVTLFCDVLCLCRYRDLGFAEFPDGAESQLRHAIRRGHDVQAHIHSHWPETDIQRHPNGATTYSFEPSRFLLGNRHPEGGPALRRFCADVVAQSKSFLEDLLRPIDPRYCCCAFRAGGYGVQPHDKDIFGALADAGFLVDSSVVPGMVLQTNVNRIDFSCVPRAGNYYVDSRLGINHAAENGIFEIPILALRKGEARWLVARQVFGAAIRRLSGKSGKIWRGYTAQTTAPGAMDMSFAKRIARHLRTIRRGWFMLELSPDPKIMVAAARRYIEHYHPRAGGTLYFSVSIHSKSLDERLLSSLVSFHRRLAEFYGPEVRAITFREAVDDLIAAGRLEA